MPSRVACCSTRVLTLSGSRSVIRAVPPSSSTVEGSGERARRRPGSGGRRGPRAAHRSGPREAARPAPVPPGRARPASGVGATPPGRGPGDRRPRAPPRPSPRRPPGPRERIPGTGSGPCSLSAPGPCGGADAWSTARRRGASTARRPHGADRAPATTRALRGSLVPSVPPPVPHRLMSSCRLCDVTMTSSATSVNSQSCSGDALARSCRDVLLLPQSAYRGG